MNKKYLEKAKSKLRQKYQVFKRWQRMPHRVKSMSAEEFDCPTCHTHFQGNYCPRCGQSSKVGRYSFKKALLLYLDVWGLGNRSMFRTIRDLILRPGYMILDYLKGMQMAYFPPFKMLFLLTALSILVAHGFNIRMKSNANGKGNGGMEMVFTEKPDSLETASDSLAAAVDSMTARTDSLATDSLAVSAPQADDTDEMERDEIESVLRFLKAINLNRMNDLQERFPNILTLLSLLILTFFLYPFFRKTKNVQNLRYSEFFIANLYITNMMTIYETVLAFFCIGSSFTILIYLMEIVALRQFSGFSTKRTFFSFACGCILTVLATVVFAILLGITAYGISKII